MIDDYDEDGIRIATLKFEEKLKCAMRKIGLEPMEYRNGAVPLLRAAAKRRNWR